MKTVLLSLYLVTLALWTGGVALFTFLVTPAIFRSYARDQAGEIVGRLFPGYFLYLLVLSMLALVLFLLLRFERSGMAGRVSLVLIAAALIVNAYIHFRLHPETVKVKQQIASFEREAPDSPARAEFRKLHGISAGLNLFVLAEGVALLVLSRSLGK